ncbi:MAG: hypothetical protein CVT49_12880 [candidate division Zixibacteria bacterium HGW-Zixibacteria-1]|nr:MAG: hypothetical protein CVT49_12880 [candidate division Zixibacteria bacterium HGW-Zixibacteria-1]
MAEYLGVKVSTIYQWTHIGFIPHMKLGRLVRFKENDVLKWLESKNDNGRKAKKIELNML